MRKQHARDVASTARRSRCPTPTAPKVQELLLLASRVHRAVFDDALHRLTPALGHFRCKNGLSHRVAIYRIAELWRRESAHAVQRETRLRCSPQGRRARASRPPPQSQQSLLDRRLVWIVVLRAVAGSCSSPAIDVMKTSMSSSSQMNCHAQQWHFLPKKKGRIAPHEQFEQSSLRRETTVG